MTVKMTEFKAEHQIADFDCHYYIGHALMLARHSSKPMSA